MYFRFYLFAALRYNFVTRDLKRFGYNSKSDKAASEAQTTAQKSSDQAYKANNGVLSDAKSAKKKAKKALNDAEDADDAKSDVKSQEKKINRLTSELQKKQKQLADLDAIRSSIRNMPPQLP